MAIDPFFGSVLAAGANLAGGLLGSGAASDANKAAAENAAMNRQAQYEFAQYGTTWKALDVINAYKATGIHPLSLLGVAGPTYSPSSPAFVGSSGIGEAVSKMGQDISRGIYATADRQLREEARAAQVQRDALLLERGQLENQSLRLQILSQEARLRQESAPAVPTGTRFLVDGQGEAATLAPRGGLEGLVKVNPLGVTAVSPHGAESEPAAVSDFGWAYLGRNAEGNQEWKRIPSKDIKDRIEDIPGAGWEWWFRNGVLPGLISRYGPPMPAPKGYYWQPHVGGTYELRSYSKQFGPYDIPKKGGD